MRNDYDFDDTLEYYMYLVVLTLLLCSLPFGIVYLVDLIIRML